MGLQPLASGRFTSRGGCAAEVEGENGKRIEWRVSRSRPDVYSDNFWDRSWREPSGSADSPGGVGS